MIKNIPNFNTGLAQNKTDSLYPYLWDGLVGMWCPSVGKQGDTLTDFSLYKRNGILTNFIQPPYIPSITGYNIEYDGVNQFIDIGNIEEINDATQDLSFIFKLKTNTAQTNHAMFVYDSNSSLSPSTDIYCMFKANFTVGGMGDGGEWNTGYPSSNLQDGVQHTVSIILKDLLHSLYVDGVLVASRAVSHIRGNYSAGHLLRIADNSNVLHYTGEIGDFFVYKRALGFSEIIDIHNNRLPLTPAPFTIPVNIFIGANPDSLDATLSVEQPNIIIDSIFTANPLDITSQILAPLVGQVVTVTPNTLDITSSIENPSVSSQVTITPDILSISSSVEAPIFPVIGALIAKIISINPLIAVTDTSPVQIIKIDITDPLDLIFESVTIVNINNAKDVSVDSSGNFVFVTGSAGKVVKVEIADLSNQTTIDLNDTNDITTIETNSNFGLTYAGTNSSIGELYLIDDRSTFKMDSNFNALEQRKFFMESSFQTVDTFRINANFNALGQQRFFIGANFNCLTKPAIPTLPTVNRLDNIEPIHLQDYRVFVDNIELGDTDLVLNSISITENIGQEAKATFQLTRKHDNFNKTLEGVSVPINNKNGLKITVRGETVFDGNIFNIDCQYNINGEFVKLDASAPEKKNKFNKITMSLPGITSRLSLYDILVQNPKIIDPVIDPINTVNPKKFKGIKVNLGKRIEQNNQRFRIFDSNGNIADQIQEGTFNPQQNWTYFWSPTVKKLENVILDIPETTEEEDELTQFNNSEREKEISDRKPWLRNHIRIRQILNRISEGIQNTIDKITKSVSTLIPLNSIEFFYIGTSLSPVSEDLWDLKQASHWRQAINSDSETGKISLFNSFPGFITVEETILPSSTPHKYGHVPIEFTTYYMVGEAPFKEITAKNGIKITKPRYADEQDGLYSIKDAGFDYRQFAKKVADLEYEKLKNINGNILPDTSCTLNMTIDAYLYYGISLLTRINIDNTTEPNIFNDNNGFAVSVKSITINSSDRKVVINADNIKSTKELEELNSQFPDPDDDEYNTPATRTLIQLKSDMRTRLKVERTIIENEQRLE